ncbi:MAG TPA: ABC transporter permease [Pyrinomonadaceae bacterium]
MLRHLIPDLKLAFRMLLKKPVFTLAALLNLAIGIGVNTAIFSVVNAVLLQPLPYTNPNELVFIWDTQRDKAEKLTYPVSAPNFRDWQEHNKTLASMSAYSFDYLNLVGRDKPERLFIGYVSSNFLTTFGVTPALGRGFTVGKGESSPYDELIISNALWQRSFGGDPNIIGQRLTLNGNSFVVVGVLPHKFQIPRQVSLGFVSVDDIDALVPLSFVAHNEPPTMAQRGRHFLHAVGRLKPGVSVQQASSDMTTLASSLEQQFPAENTNFTVHLVPVHEQITGRVRPALLLLLAAVGLVLLIACSNVANLLLARYAGRQREFAIRMALGAGSWRLFQQLVTESLVLGLIGGALGLLLAFGAIQVLAASDFSEIPRLMQLGVDGWVLGFTLLLSLATTIIFALAPAFQYIRPDTNKALRDDERASTTPISRKLRNALVVVEMALALMLLIGAGLLIKSFNRILALDMGFNPQNVLTAEIFLPRDKYPKPDTFVEFNRRLMEKLRNEPGVESVALVNVLPLKGNRSVNIGVQGRPEPPPGQELIVSQRIVTPDYFKTMGIPLRQGRLFTEYDTSKSPPVALISEGLARRLWANQNPVGEFITTAPDVPASEVVGVVGDVNESGEGLEDSEPEFYLAYQQVPWRVFTVLVRSASDTGQLTGMIQRNVISIDKDQPVSQPALMETVLADKLSQRRLNMWLLGLFGAVALVLALVGIYGVISYTVTQRTHELGLRMALGAQPFHIMKLIVGHGMSLAVIGIGIGLVGAFWLSRYLTTLVFGVSVKDPIIFVGSAALLFIAALIACYIPARRALRVYPMQALRHN